MFVAIMIAQGVTRERQRLEIREETMNTVESLERKLDQVRALGYEVHYDWFGGTGGGACQLGRRKCLFLDLAQSPVDHLELVEDLLSRFSYSTKAA